MCSGLREVNRVISKNLETVQNIIKRRGNIPIEAKKSFMKERNQMLCVFGLILGVFKKGAPSNAVPRFPFLNGLSSNHSSNIRGSTAFLYESNIFGF